MRLGFGVAVRTVEPFSAARRADGDLGVQNVFAHGEAMTFVTLTEVYAGDEAVLGGKSLNAGDVL